MAVVTISMDGMMFSGGAVSTVQGSGTFAVFNYTSHVPSGHFTMDNHTAGRCRQPPANLQAHNKMSFASGLCFNACVQ
jgi:hypothetical protein